MAPQARIGLLTLTALEIVSGIDNIVFISILVGKLLCLKSGADEISALHSLNPTAERSPPYAQHLVLTRTKYFPLS